MSESVLIALIGGIFSILAIITQNYFSNKRNREKKPTSQIVEENNQTVVQRIIIQHPQPKIPYGIRSSVLFAIAFVSLLVLGIYETDIDSISDEEAAAYFFVWGGTILFGFYYMILGIIHKFKKH